MLLSLAHLDVPFAPNRVFGREAPLAVEIGIGSGRFLDALAEGRPDWNVLGVERSSASVVRTWRRLRQADRQHARLLKGSAQLFVRSLAPRHSLHRVYVNFPDPWPRLKHRHKRFLSAPFLRLLSTRLADGGALLLTSDHPGYFHDTLAEVHETGLYAVEEAPPPPEALQTKYAHKWQAQERTFHHAVFTKLADADETYPPLISIEPMHHALLEGTLPAVRSFEKEVHPFRHGVVVLMDAYRLLDAEGLAFLVHIEEADLTQEVIVEARPAKEEGTTLVTLKRFADPLFTHGVRAAVDTVAAWLAGHGMTIRYRRY